ncbi:MAG: ribose 5-phosphate isomerase B [Firmicutes bacterium HGW-Firmicutes-7]|nr:MAG: ribose 5-phosphate isomerase B [Firmicutes bacterium HGW-Firmicutes-7]
MKIGIGSDQNAYALKMIIIKHLEAKGYECVDFGSAEGECVLYPDVALKVSEEAAKGSFERGILVCGTGIGMAIVANKVPGVRAAVCHDVYSAQRARKSNDAQIMTLGAEIVGPALARELVDAWLDSEFQGGGSQPKVDLINEIDNKYKTK